MRKIPVLVVIGPTAVGKTRVAIQMAHKLAGEIVSADSMQVYKYMDIGTAKPSITERQGVPHHIIDIVDPSEEYSVAMFQCDADKAIRHIHSRGGIPIVAGGTGLYINSLIFPMDFTDARDDPNFRQEMEELKEKEGITALHNKLRDIDKSSADRLHPNDTRRVIRALEIHHLTGKTMSQYQQDFTTADSPYDLIIIGLNMERSLLYSHSGFPYSSRSYNN